MKISRVWEVTSTVRFNFFKLHQYYLPSVHISLYTFEDYFYISRVPNHGQSRIDHTQWWVVTDLLASLPKKKNKKKP